MAISFPSSPTNGQIHSASNKSWTWTGYSWKKTASSASGLLATQSYVQSLLSQAQTEQSTSYTLTLDDAHKLVIMTGASASTVTVPANSSVAFELGDAIDIVQRGSGAVTISGASGVTINTHADDTAVLDGQYAYASLVKVGTDEWDLFGRLVAA